MMTDATYATVIDAVFAMNAYQHDPDDGAWVQHLQKYFGSLNSDELGDYFVTNVSSESDQEENNFFAIAYTSADPSEGTIIAYRGTTDPGVSFSLSPLSPTGDAFNGYGVGVGSPYGNDAADAAIFYQDVADQLDEPWQGASDITVVGHSLGGGFLPNVVVSYVVEIERSAEHLSMVYNGVRARELSPFGSTIAFGDRQEAVDLMWPRDGF